MNTKNSIYKTKQFLNFGGHIKKYFKRISLTPAVVQPSSAAGSDTVLRVDLRRRLFFATWAGLLRAGFITSCLRLLLRRDPALAPEKHPPSSPWFIATLMITGVRPLTPCYTWLSQQELENKTPEVLKIRNMPYRLFFVPVISQERTRCPEQQKRASDPPSL